MLQRHILPAWKNLTPQSIPWAEQRALTAPYPSQFKPETYKAKYTVRQIFAPELNSYPQAVVVNPYPAFVPPKINASKFDTRFYRPVDVNKYLLTPSANDSYPASFVVKTHKSRFDQKWYKALEVNQYLLTPSASDDYPASYLLKTNKTEYNVKWYKSADFYQFAVAPGAGDSYPASFKVVTNRSGFATNWIYAPELNERPATPAAAAQPLTAFMLPITQKSHFDVKWLTSVSLAYVSVLAPTSVAITGKLKLRFAAEDTKLAHSYEDRTMIVPKSNRDLTS